MIVLGPMVFSSVLFLVSPVLIVSVGVGLVAVSVFLCSVVLTFRRQRRRRRRSPFPVSLWPHSGGRWWRSPASFRVWWLPLCPFVCTWVTAGVPSFFLWLCLLLLSFFAFLWIFWRTATELVTSPITFLFVLLGFLLPKEQTSTSALQLHYVTNLFLAFLLSGTEWNEGTVRVGVVRVGVATSGPLSDMEDSLRFTGASVVGDVTSLCDFFLDSGILSLPSSFTKASC